jgi:hypothetical protein
MALSAQDVFPSLPSAGSDLARKFAKPDAPRAPTGFEGSISNLTLTDVIQLEGQNHFSGSVLVLYQEQEGQIFFHQGEVVHAEVGSYVGEDAFNRIMGWPGGSFRLHPNVTSLRQSIQKRREHLLLSAHQWLDESRSGMVDPEASVSTGDPVLLPKNLARAICEVPGVSHAVLMDAEGIPLGEVGAREEGLAAKGVYLATMIGARVGEALGLGDLQAATMHAGVEKVLLLRSSETCLSVCMTQEAHPEEVESGIRHLLSARTEAF